jgi:hypothetical protein
MDESSLKVFCNLFQKWIVPSTMDSDYSQGIIGRGVFFDLFKNGWRLGQADDYPSKRRKLAELENYFRSKRLGCSIKGREVSRGNAARSLTKTLLLL